MTTYRGAAGKVLGMKLATDLSSLRRLDWRDRFLLAEAVATLARASVEIRLVPFRRLMASLRPPHSTVPDRSAREAEIERVRWAIEACARRLPWRIVCFQKGLALFRMLRRRAIETTLHYGVAMDPGSELKAHVWVTRNADALIGGEEAGQFTCLATFPPEGSRQQRRAT